MVHDYATVTAVDELADELHESSSVPDWLAAQSDRIVDTAQRVAQGSPLDDDYPWCLIATDWVSYAGSEFGYDTSSDLNVAALGKYVHDRSATSDASLFEDTIVIQTGWLRTGDGRKTQMKRYEDEDFEKSDPGELWVPDGAARFMTIIALDDPLVRGEPSAAEAM